MDCNDFIAYGSHTLFQPRLAGKDCSVSPLQAPASARTSFARAFSDSPVSALHGSESLSAFTL